MKKIKKLTWKLLNILRLGGPLQLVLNGALVDDGWYRSFHSKESVDRNGGPLPWCTYSFIRFMEPRLKKHFDVFEFGCGNSTRWYAPKVHSIKSVEHNKTWFEFMTKKLTGNGSVVYRELSPDGEYAKEVLKDGKMYHVIIIDGGDRNNCLRHALNKLKEDGVIIYDNSDRADYAPSFKLLAENGFKRIDFYGLAPIVNYNSCTSVFYRSNNCLNI